MLRLRRSPVVASRRSGFSLIELMIAGSLVLLVVGGVSNLISGGASVFGESARSLDLDTRTGRTIDRVLQEISCSGGDDVDAQLIEGVAMTSLTYRPSNGRAAGAEQWGDESRLDLVLVGGELPNGIDDNGNGSVDEWQLELTQRPGAADEITVVLVRGISDLAEGETANGFDDNGNGLADEPGFSIVRNGDIVTLRITVERSEEGRLTQRTAERRLCLKN